MSAIMKNEMRGCYMTNRERIDSAMMKAYNNERADFVRSMNNIMVHMNDENAYMKWIEVVPDRADEEDFKAIADDEELFDDVVYLFKDLMERYMKNGIYIGKTCY